MAEFKGKLIEAYFSNNEKDTICAVFNTETPDGPRATDFYINVDPNEYYYQELLKEMTIEEIEAHTQKRLETYTENLKKLVKKWAGGDIKEWDPKSVDKVVNTRIINFLFNFDKDDKKQQELMFRMKLKMFEQDVVKNAKDKDAEKSDLRKAETPLDVILSYATIINKLGKRFKK
tara:strand:+ start:1392 stop:1916 length:525 start_codon:yes stop_codon:yes gene_type:complete